MGYCVTAVAFFVYIGKSWTVLEYVITRLKVYKAISFLQSRKLQNDELHLVKFHTELRNLHYETLDGFYAKTSSNQ